MKTMKTWTAAVLALVMVLGTAGCSNREPTAKELLAGIPAIDPGKYYDMAIEMDAGTEINGQASGIAMTFGIENSGSVTHLYDMDLSLDASGISIAFSLEGWIKAPENTLYCRMTIFGEDSGWMILSRNSDSGVFPAQAFREMIDGISSLPQTNAEPVLEPHTEGGDYVVTWTETEGDAGGLSGSLGSLLDSFAADGRSAGSGWLDLAGAAVKAHFDEKTRDLKSIRIEAGAAGSAGGSSTVCITFTFHTVNGEQKLNVPQDVTDTAVDMSGLL